MKTAKILMVLRVLAWVALIGYAVNLGSQLICFAVSFINPVAAQGIPGVDQDLSSLLSVDFQSYTYAMSFAMAISAMFMCLWYAVIGLFSKLDTNNPFTQEVSKQIEQVTYWLVAISLVTFIGEIYLKWLSKRLDVNIEVLHVSKELLYGAGIVYLISQIFKRGVELQQEQELTI